MGSTGQWGRIKELFDAALQCEPEQRAEFLQVACGSDEVLRAEVHSLLSAYAGSDGLSNFALPVEMGGDFQTNTSIGPYLLLKKIGEGGMGQVWLAEQSAPLHRQVALKLIRPGMFHDSLLHRFRAERQSLAMMDHPSIAKVFDAGATADGRPFFVMEYVPGEPITAYCDSKRLNIRERLELFMKACEGVQHAHQKAIIHRDLKPANILVVETNGKPVPRIIDFGLAKAATPAIAGETSFTHAGGFVGTPGYMSPEQADPVAGDIDTRTDVYSLGVILYELLTGFLPFDTKHWKKLPIYEVIRQLREQEPSRPSTKVETGKEVSQTAAQLRGTETNPLVRALRGDLDWITMKAIERDRGRRYGTPSDLAADIGRYLNNEPITARPAEAFYRINKYLIRHWAGVSVASGLLILLAGFAALQARQLRRTTIERDRATRITEFMTHMFMLASPTKARGNSITVREVLDKASKDIDTGLSNDPELRGQMLSVMGVVYDDLGLYPEAEHFFQRAFDIQRSILGMENHETLATATNLAWTWNHQGRYAMSAKLLGQTLEVQKRTLGIKSRETLSTMTALGAITANEGRYLDAEKLEREALRIKRDVLGPKDALSLVSADNLTWTLRRLGRYLEAEQLGKETLADATQVFGPEEPFRLDVAESLTETLNKMGKYEEAEKLSREIHELQVRVLGPTHLETLISNTTLANILANEGRLKDSEKIYRKTIELELSTVGAEHPTTLETKRNLAAAWGKMERYEEAEAIARETLATSQKIFGPEHPKTLESATILAGILAKRGEYTSAEKLLRSTIDAQQRVLPPNNPSIAISIYTLGAEAALHGQNDKSISMLQEAVDHGFRRPWIVASITTLTLNRYIVMPASESSSCMQKRKGLSKPAGVRVKRFRASVFSCRFVALATSSLKLDRALIAMRLGEDPWGIFLHIRRN